VQQNVFASRLKRCDIVNITAIHGMIQKISGKYRVVKFATAAKKITA